MKKIKITVSFVFVLLAISAYKKEVSQPKTELQNLTQYVDPYIGTGEHGHVFLGANVPFGLVQVGATNISGGWDWVSGYHISDSTIWAFTHTHLSGTGIGDLLDVALMPVVGDVTLGKGDIKDPNSGVYSLFKRDKEVAKPGYYQVYLERYGINVALTATERVGLHKYTFPKSSESKVIIDLKSAINWDSPTDAYLVYENDSTVSGYRYSTGWAKDQRIYFTAEFSKPMKKFLVSEDNTNILDQKELKGKGVYGQVLFDTKENEDIYVKVALSPVSIENAKLNMKTEAPGWHFDELVAQANDDWNKELNRIQIQTLDNHVMCTFYTALYHTMIAPSEFNDVNKDYLGTDKKVYKAAPFTNYTTFSLWDTYRAAMPLMSIIHPERMNDIVNTMLAIYQQQGKLPVWHLMGCETDCMVGNPGVNVVADAMLKGYSGFDKELAYQTLKNSVMLDERSMDLRKKYGYIPYDLDPAEGLSKDMEYAIADWSVAQIAKQMGKEDDYQFFLNRSKSYKKYFDKNTGFVRGVDSKGKFRPNFNPFESIHRENDYTEGNAWQYTWLVPQDIKGLVEEFGSNQAFLTKLDSLFIVEGSLGENASPDISGLIGQYAHGNEPSHHVIYMYPYLGKNAKAADLVRQVLAEQYSDTPEGIAGNEDVGQISAWYILSSLGFYQVEPAGGKYVFGSPIVNEATIQVANNKTFKIIAHNNSATNKYIQSVKLNGAPYDKFYILFSNIEKGGTLEFEMGDNPNIVLGVDETIQIGS